MKNENIAIPIIALGALIITSFAPIIQILIMYLNGAILYVIMIVIGEGETVQYIANGLLSLATLVLFYKSQTTIWKILTVLFTIIFLLPMLATALDNALGEDPFYFLPMMLAGLISGIALIIVGLFKSRGETNR